MRPQPHDAAHRPPAVRPAPRGRAPGLPVRETLVTAATAGWRYRWPILAVAVSVSLAAALADVAAHTLIDRSALPASVTADLIVALVDLLGLVLLSGVLTKLVGACHGGREVSVREALTSLAWGRLILADLLVGALVAIGFVLLIVPGLVAFTFLSVTGPVIEAEDRAVLAALRRSVRLVRPHFWWVMLLASLPSILISEVPVALPESVNLHRLLAFLAIRGIGVGIAEAAAGLVLVELRYRLADSDRR